eukprot:2660076-Prymnesium_polylepis.1
MVDAQQLESPISRAAFAKEGVADVQTASPGRLQAREPLESNPVGRQAYAPKSLSLCRKTDIRLRGCVFGPPTRPLLPHMRACCPCMLVPVLMWRAPPRVQLAWRSMMGKASNMKDNMSKMMGLDEELVQEEEEVVSEE